MPKSRVIKLTNPRIYKSDKSFDLAELSKLVNTCIQRLTETSDTESAWKKIVKPGETIGIKPNCLGGKALSSSPQIAQIMVKGLISAGIIESDIIIWERTNRELENAGYELNYSKSNGLRCFGTDSRGVGYSQDFYQSGKVASLISIIFESLIDKNINFPLLKDHSIAGISAGLKNFYGLVHNPNKYHPDHGNPFAADISNLPIVRQKNILTVCDLTRVQYHGGPGYRASYLVHPGGIMMSFDPIALDTCGYKIIDDLRVQNKMQTLKEAGRVPLWLKTAAQLGLGNSDLEQIDLIEEVIGCK